MVTDKVPGPVQLDPDALVAGVLGDPVGKVLAVCCDAREAGREPGIRCNRTDEAVPGAAPSR